MASQQEAADWIDISTRQFRKLQQQGILPPVKGKGGLDLKDVTKAYIDYLRAQAKTGNVDEEKSENELSYHQERTLLINRQREKLELEISVQRADLIPKDLVVDEVSEVFASVKSQLLALPSRMSPLLLSKDDLGEVESICREGIKDALKGISNDFLK